MVKVQEREHERTQERIRSKEQGEEKGSERDVLRGQALYDFLSIPNSVCRSSFNVSLF